MVSRRRRYSRWGRIGVAACLVLLTVFATFRGFADMLRDEPKAVASRTAEQRFPDDEARAFAVRFTHAFLTYSPERVDEQVAALQGMFTERLRLESAVQVPRTGRGLRVLEAFVARVEHGAQRGTVTVGAIVRHGSRTSTRYIAVPVARDRHGGLVVDDYPSFVSPPAAATVTPKLQETPVPEADGAAIEALLRRFLREYLRGGAVAPEFLAPGARVVKLGTPYELEDITSLAQVGAATGSWRRVLAVVRARDRRTSAVYTLRYRFGVVFRDRWLITTIQG